MSRKESKALVSIAKAPKKVAANIENKSMPALKPISGKEFILLLKKYPCLYDRSHPEFVKHRSSLNAWNNLAAQTGRRAKSLKDRFNKMIKAAQNGAPKSVELVCLLNSNWPSSSEKRHSREHKLRSILKSNVRVANGAKRVRFVKEDDNNNHTDDDITDEQFFDFLKSKLSKLSIDQRSELKAFVKAKIPEYFLSLGQ